MTDWVNFAAGLVWVAVIGAWLTYQAWARKAERRQLTHSCVRCGRAPETVVAGAAGGHMCEQCRALTRRNYRAGYLFFVSVGALFVLFAPILLVLTYRRFGTLETAKTLVLVAGVGALSAGMGLAIRRYGMKRLS